MRPRKYVYYMATKEELGAFDPDAAMGNPLKGLYSSPWYNDYNASKNVIPATLEWYYIGFNDLMINDPDVVGVDLAFNWTKLDNALHDSASRSMHAIFTTVIHYPGKPLMLPSYLLDNPSLILHTYDDLTGDGISPDYGDPLLLKAIEQLIVAMGARYDGDKRIASVHTGFLGFWGEWHTYPHEGWVPEDSKRKVTQWYQNAFSNTKVQGRYPYEPMLDAGFGLSDGSFAYHTLDGDANGNVEQSWYFWNKVKEKNATNTFWRKSFMSGETRPEIQSFVFEPDYPARTFERQDFMECVNTTHTSFMFHHDAFDNQYTGQKLQNALFAHNRMGYNFIISKVAIVIPKQNFDVNTVSVSVTIKQKGIAPFYYPLSLQLHCYNSPDQDTSHARTKKGVESIIEQNKRKRFTFVNITHNCLKNLTFTLDSPYAYADRPVQFAQRGLYNNETTASVSIFNVPIPTNQNLMDAIEYYNNTAVSTMLRSFGGVEQATFPSLTPTFLSTSQPTMLDSISLTSPSTSVVINQNVSHANYPTLPPATSDDITAINAPKTTPMINSNCAHTPSVLCDRTVTTVSTPVITILVTSTNTSLNVTSVPQSNPPHLTTSQSPPPQRQSSHTNSFIAYIVLISCILMTLILYRRYKLARQKEQKQQKQHQLSCEKNSRNCRQK